MKKLNKSTVAATIARGIVLTNHINQAGFTTSQETTMSNITTEQHAELIKLIEEMGYEKAYHKLTAVHNSKVGSKMEGAKRIYAELKPSGTRRCDIIRAFMAQLDMSKEGAGTYYQKIDHAARAV